MEKTIKHTLLTTLCTTLALSGVTLLNPDHAQADGKFCYRDSDSNLRCHDKMEQIPEAHQKKAFFMSSEIDSRSSSRQTSSQAGAASNSRARASIQNREYINRDAQSPVSETTVSRDSINREPQSYGNTTQENKQQATATGVKRDQPLSSRTNERKEPQHTTRSDHASRIQTNTELPETSLPSSSHSSSSNSNSNTFGEDLLPQMKKAEPELNILEENTSASRYPSASINSGLPPAKGFDPSSHGTNTQNHQAPDETEEKEPIVPVVPPVVPIAVELPPVKTPPAEKEIAEKETLEKKTLDKETPSPIAPALPSSLPPAKGTSAKETTPTKSNTSASVKIFVADWCSNCKVLEKFLIDEKVAYKKFDVEKDPEGIKVYEEHGSVPISMIGSNIVIGFEADRYRSLIDASVPY